MPTASIEILCAEANCLTLVDNQAALAIATSWPAVSDRMPSLWQKHMSEVGGTLVHLFDPTLRGQRNRWAYDIIEEYDWERFRFRPAVCLILWGVLQELIEISPRRLLWFYSDAQWSSEPRIWDKEVSLDEFRNYHNNDALEFNTAISIVG